MERYWQRTTTLLLAALTVLVVVLTRQNSELKESYGAVRDAQIVPARGAWIPSFALPSLDGNGEATFGAGASGHLILVFDPSCAASRQATRWFHELAPIARSSGFTASALSRADAAEVESFLAVHAPLVPAYRSTPREHSYLGVRVLPTIILLDTAGRVKYAHAGALSHQEFEEIKAAVRSDSRNGAALM